MPLSLSSFSDDMGGVAAKLTRGGVYNPTHDLPVPPRLLLLIRNITLSQPCIGRSFLSRTLWLSLMLWQGSNMGSSRWRESLEDTSFLRCGQQPAAFDAGLSYEMDD